MGIKGTIISKVSEVQKDILFMISRRRDSGQHLVKRARVVMLACEQQTNKQIADEVGMCENTVRTWQKRWKQKQEKLDMIEAEGNEKAVYKYIVEEVLADDPYNGKRGKYTAEQVAQLYALACEKPEDSGRPISHWSCRELAEEMVKRGIVEHIPISTVWDFLKSGGIKAA